MPSTEFSELENAAIADAGEAGGAYLASLEKFDLSQLSRDEWLEFIARVVDGFGAAMKHRCETGEVEVPFDA